MFIFRSRRTALSKRLWKARARRQSDEAGSEIQDSYGPESGESLRQAALLKRLKDNQLEMLLSAVESKGQKPIGCVLVNRGQLPEPHVQICRTWIWPDLRDESELRPLPICPAAHDNVYICCNPYHWSRLSKPESPPPPYCRFAMDTTLKPEDRAPSENAYRRRGQWCSIGSITTDGEDAHAGGWCQLAYWELAQRVGRLFPVELPAVNVFSAQPLGDGLCLATLAQHSAHLSQSRHPNSTPDAVRRARDKIGLGVTLSQEADGIWVYNRSEAPIFVNSPTLDDIDSRVLLVYRVSSGNCLKVFDYTKSTHVNYGWKFSAPQGPVDPNSVRISFAKGWGPKYSRQEVTACPCWLEVLLAPCR